MCATVSSNTFTDYVQRLTDLEGLVLDLCNWRGFRENDPLFRTLEALRNRVEKKENSEKLNSTQPQTTTAAEKVESSFSAVPENVSVVFNAMSSLVEVGVDPIVLSEEEQNNEDDHIEFEFESACPYSPARIEVEVDNVIIPPDLKFQEGYNNVISENQEIEKETVPETSSTKIIPAVVSEFGGRRNRFKPQQASVPNALPDLSFQEGLGSDNVITNNENQDTETVTKIPTTNTIPETTEFRLGKRRKRLGIDMLPLPSTVTSASTSENAQEIPLLETVTQEDGVVEKRGRGRPRKNKNQQKINILPTIDHGIQNPRVRRGRGRYQNKKKGYACLQCQFVFPAAQERYKHWMDNHNKKYISKRVARRNIQQKQQRILQEGSKLNKKIYKCPTCDAVFLKYSRFYYHKRNAGACRKNMEYTKSTIEESTSSNSNIERSNRLLKRKQQEVQNPFFKLQDKPFKCPNCNETFNKYAQLYYHKRNGQYCVRTPPPDHAGKMMSISKLISVSEHMNTSVSERDPLLPVVGAVAIQPQFPVSEGTTTPASLTENKPYHCSNCNETFMKHAQWYYHRRNGEFCARTPQQSNSKMMSISNHPSSGPKLMRSGPEQEPLPIGTISIQPEFSVSEETTTPTSSSSSPAKGDTIMFIDSDDEEEADFKIIIQESRSLAEEEFMTSSTIQVQEVEVGTSGISLTSERNANEILQNGNMKENEGIIENPGNSSCSNGPAPHRTSKRPRWVNRDHENELFSDRWKDYKPLFIPKRKWNTFNLDAPLVMLENMKISDLQAQNIVLLSRSIALTKNKRLIRNNH